MQPTGKKKYLVPPLSSWKVMTELKYSLMKECKEVSHDNDDRLRVGRDDRFELSRSLCLVLYFWEEGVDRKMSSCLCALSHTHWHVNTRTQTYGHAPGVGWCFQWGREDSPDLWSRASTLQQRSPGHMSAQPGDPLLQGKPTAPCPTLLKLHSEEGATLYGYIRVMPTHSQTHTRLPLSNASLRLLISIWEPGTLNIPSWWRPGRQPDYYDSTVP